MIDKEAHEIQIWSVLGLFICIISGFGIASYLAKKSYNPLKMLMENFARMIIQRLWRERTNING